jgi:acetoin utilization deacetylase AcuC-like enzyme
MKVVYHPGYEEVYASDPAAKAGRMESILKELPPQTEMVTPEPASVEDVRLVHSDWHITDIQRHSHLYQAALLAAGGAIRAAAMAVAGEPTFGLIRPPGHHASPDHCWGFCFFNNMAISIAKLRHEGAARTAVILDIDLHFGDGTDNIFRTVPDVVYFHPGHGDGQGFKESISSFLEGQSGDIIAVSAGFDRHVEDWGGQLTTGDYRDIGHLVTEFSERTCKGRRYAVLEGGYNHSVLGKNVRALMEELS